MGPRHHMGASPKSLGRPPRFSAVHGPCREHCRALVQAFLVWLAQARIKPSRQVSSKKKSKCIPQISSSTSLPASGCMTSEEVDSWWKQRERNTELIEEKISLVREWHASSEFQSKFLVHPLACLCPTAVLDCPAQCALPSLPAPSSVSSLVS